MSRKLLTVAEAIDYQISEHGRAVYKRDALYAAVRSGNLPAVRHGVRRLYISVAALEHLLRERATSQPQEE